MAITPGMIMGGMGLVGGLAGMFGGKENSPQGSMQPWMNNFGAGAGNAANSIGGLGQYNLGAQFMPGVAGIAQGYMNNPYAGGYQQGAGQFGALGGSNALMGLSNAQQFGGMAPGLAGTGNQFFGQIPTAMGAGNAILNTAFDPQNALYNRTAQQTADQSLAGLANSGLAQTPWGQGVHGNTMSNFNIDWQNAQLGRQAQGIQGMTGAFGAASGLEGTGLGAYGAGMGLANNAFNLGQGAWQGGVGASAAPWGAANSILGGQAQGPQFAANYGNTVSQIPQQQAGDWLSYMSGQTGAGQLALQGQQQGFNQNQVWGKDIGQSLALLTGQVNPGSLYGGNRGGMWPQQQPGGYGYYG